MLLWLFQPIDEDYLYCNLFFHPVAYITNSVLTVCLTQFTAMKSESSCGSLCQHPECWRSNLQRVKDAVRLRNGIHSNETVEDFDTLAKSRRKSDEGEQVRSLIKNVSIKLGVILLVTENGKCITSILYLLWLVKLPK